MAQSSPGHALKNLGPWLHFHCISKYCTGLFNIFAWLQYFFASILFLCKFAIVFDELMLVNQVKIEHLPTFTSRVVSLASDQSFIYCGLASGQIKSVLSSLFQQLISLFRVFCLLSGIEVSSLRVPGCSQGLDLMFLAVNASHILAILHLSGYCQKCINVNISRNKFSSQDLSVYGGRRTGTKSTVESPTLREDRFYEYKC